MGILSHGLKASNIRESFEAGAHPRRLIRDDGA